MIDFRTWSAETKARFVTVLFVFVGIIAWMYRVHDSSVSLPLAFFYAGITLNTYFSVRFFTSLIPPENTAQQITDVLLAVEYLLLAWFLPTPVAFVFFALCLFITATVKYALLLNIFPHPLTLKRKILIDLMGIMLCTGSLGGMLLGYVTLFSWIFVLIFTGMNLYFLTLRPMYRI